MNSNLWLLFILLLGSCNGNDIEDCLKCKLQGEWIGPEDEEVLIIQGDSIIEGQPWLIKFFEPYKIIDQTSIGYRVLTKSTKTKALNILIFYAFNIAKNTNLKSVSESFNYKTDLKKEQKNNKLRK